MSNQEARTDRPYARHLTAEIRDLLERSEQTGDFLHSVYVELTHRDRKAARELREFIAERLKILGGQYFPWPTTAADGGSGQLEYFQHKQGLLGFLGYHVGASGIDAEKRQQLLHDVYSGPLPSLNSVEYMAEWGSPSTGMRLHKMAESIAAFARNAKRKGVQPMSDAIAEWESDLEFLRRTYYVGRYDFSWPETSHAA